MKNIIKIALLSVLIIIPGWVLALSSNPAHTHTNTPIELKSVSSGLGTQYASVCFLGVGDCTGGNFGDMEVDPGDQCKNGGFTNTCPAGQKLKKDPRCEWDKGYGICCKETCPTNAAASCTGDEVGSDGCGYTCKKCCVPTCPSGFDYTESQLTGSSGSGWVKDGNDFCDHCTRGRLYKRKAATCSSSYKSCGCGGDNACKAGNNTYYQTCDCCSSCTGSTSNRGMKYYNSCYNSCTQETLYTERSCDSRCSGSSPCGSGYFESTSRDECGNTCYECNRGKLYKNHKSGYVSSGTVYYNYDLTCEYPDGRSSSKGTSTNSVGCWDCDAAHLSCKASCGDCYHSNEVYKDRDYMIDYMNADIPDCRKSWTGQYCN